MGFLDKAKQQAQELKGKVEGKVEDVQQKRKASDLLEEVGRLVYAERMGRPVPEGRVDQLITELRDLEDHGVVVAPEPQPTAPPPADDGGGASA